MNKEKCKVYIVGAGAGDEGLLTLKGLDCLKKADVVIYDNLVGQRILEYIPQSSEKIYVGKKSNEHTLPQEEINDLICRKAMEGKIVVRLKGGDPFIFGRGGEECIELAERNIPFEVVPGITSAIAVPAYAGIPLTHRNVSSSVHFITGHESEGKESSAINWKALAEIDGTKVFLMGLNNIGIIAEKLMEHGQSPETPTAIISNGTMQNQKTIVADLKNIKNAVVENNITSPAIIVVGECVKYRETINWFETKPLFGKRVGITRPLDRSGDLTQKYLSDGAEVFNCPTIKIIPVNLEKLEEKIKILSQYNWIIFTSANAVEIFFDQLLRNSRDARILGNTKIAVVGSATADALKKFFITPDFIPDEFLSEKLAEQIPISPSDKVLIPCGVQSRELLSEILKKRGAVIDRINMYDTIPDEDGINKIKILINQKRIDIITFTSPSTVKYLFNMLDQEEIDFIKGIKIEPIGPITSQALKEYGIEI